MSRSLGALNLALLCDRTRRLSSVLAFRLRLGEYLGSYGAVMKRGNET
ncbi:MAG: hypothetical protein COA87_020370 [Halomonas sp.]|nr:hypothetical protein [Halomonas sp.]MBL1270050.1 hypothetical protein [Halomonas sp.]